MAFPDVRGFPASHPGPYELPMGGVIAALLRLFAGHMPDPESNTRALELASDPTRWSAGHAVVNEVRPRLLAAVRAGDAPRELQHHFEESCCQAIDKATDPPDPIDPGSAFFVAGQAIGPARVAVVPVEWVIAVLAPSAEAPE